MENYFDQKYGDTIYFSELGLDCKRKNEIFGILFSLTQLAIVLQCRYV